MWCYSSGDHRALHSFPTRRSSDLKDVVLIGLVLGWAGHHFALLGERRLLGEIVLAMQFGHILGDHRSEEHTSELQSQSNLVCRLLLEKKNNSITTPTSQTVSSLYC